jgi:hypothetical protein
MPNWVSNQITITAKSKTELDLFVAKAKGAESKILEKDSDSLLHFGAFIHPSDEELEKYNEEGWYDWNVENWGTKWDACYIDTTRIFDTRFSYSFQTAWSIPEPVFTAMAEQHPELTFEIWSEEEQGWGAEYHAENGNIVLTKEWDIPDCHADYVAKDEEDNCVCSWNEDQDEWYSDCPRPQKFFVRVTKVYELSATTMDEARVEYFQMESGAIPLPEEISDYGSVDYVDEEGEPVA